MTNTLTANQVSDTENYVVSVVTIEVTHSTFSTVAGQLAMMLAHRLPTIPGFIEGALLTNEAKTQIVLVNKWQSTHSWATAQWDSEVGGTVVDIYQETRSYALGLFVPLLAAARPLTLDS